ncbi:MAG: prepilin peptidase [Oscillospiraceae bacterium]|nr:prepilin peptidase [Oscillospiraceae bacterium]
MYKNFALAALAAHTGWKEWQYYDNLGTFMLMAIPIVFLYGICIGSFLNVVIIRIPLGESLIKRSSHCMTCGSKIRIIDLIPVFSWLFLRGKCHNCGEKISPRYPIVESLNGLLYVACFLIFGVNTYTFIMCIFTSLLICIGFIDWDTMDMYVPMLLLIAVLAIPAHFVTYLTIQERLIGGAIIAVPFLLIGEISGIYIKKKTGEKIRGIELGDTILMACAGVLLGWKAMIPATFISIFLAAIFGMIIKKKTGESKFAFGPYLCMGLLIGAWFGEELTDLYMNVFFPPEEMTYYYTSMISSIF